MLTGSTWIVMGSIISALFIQFASYRWMFYFVTILAVPSAVMSILLIPCSTSKPDGRLPGRMEQIQRLDPIGISILTG